VRVIVSADALAAHRDPSARRDHSMQRDHHFDVIITST
jgi:hypothetical protein